MKHFVTKELRIEVTMLDAAVAFANARSDEQAEFLNQVGQIMEGWGPGKEAMQLQYITDSPELARPGRTLMGLFGDYAEETDR